MSLLIIEGPDGAGKSTLVNKLSKDLKLPIYSSGGPKEITEMKEVLAEMKTLALVTNKIFICDRAPWISEIIYSKALGRESIVTDEVFNHWLKTPQKIIYCTLGDSELMLQNMSRENKPHKPLKHTLAVIESHKKICEEYEDLMAKIESKNIELFEYDWQNSSYHELLLWL